MSSLQKSVTLLSKLMTESEEILAGKQGKTKASLEQLQTRSDKIHDENRAYKAQLIAMSRAMLRYEEYFNVVHPMWGAVDAARKLLAMGKPKQASKMLEKAKSQWEKEVFTFDIEDFPVKIQTSFKRLASQVDKLLSESFAALDANEAKAGVLLRQLQSKTDNLFDVYDDSLDALLLELKGS